MNFPRIIISAICATVALNVWGAPSDTEKVECIKLLTEIPPQGALGSYVTLVRHPETAESKAELEDAQKEVQKAKVAVPKLRKLIKVGSSILDYPGLLARGRITHDGLEMALLPGLTAEYRPSDSYHWYIGVPADPEGIVDSDFEIVFDGHGVITAINSVDWKH